MRVSDHQPEPQPLKGSGMEQAGEDEERTQQLTPLPVLSSRPWDAVRC